MGKPIRKLVLMKFTQMSAYEKGYAVYMYGERKDYPDIPRTYKPTPQERANYERGQAAAVLEAQDCDDG